MNPAIGVEPTIHLDTPLRWMVVLAVLGGAFLLTRRRPDFGLALVVAALPLYQARGIINLPGPPQLPTTFLELLLGAVLLAILSTWFASGRKARKIKLTRGPYDPWLALWVGGALLAAVLSPNLRDGLGLWRAFFFEPALFFLALRAVFNDRPLTPLLWGAIGTIGLVAVWCGWLLLTGVDIAYDGRLLGPFQSANFLAMLLIPLVLMVAAWPGRDLLAVRIPAAAAGLGLIAASQSRGGYLAILAGVLVALVLKLKRLAGPALAGLGALTAVFAAASWRVFDRPDPIVSVRPILWNESLKLIQENPLLGNGPGRFQETLAARLGGNPEYARYVVPFAPNAHNLWLVTWVEWGLATLLGLLGLLVTFVRMTARQAGPWRIVSAAMMTAILVQGLVDTDMLKNDLAMVFMLVLAISVLGGSTRRDRAKV
jgi:O-antigen ligase